MKFSKTLAALLLGATSMAALASSAHAADAVAAQAPAAGFNWSGVYVGFGGGVGAALTAMPKLPLASIDAYGGDGAFAELTIGYDHLVGERLLVGAMLDGRFGKIQSKGFIFDPNTDIGSKYRFDAGLRLGYLLTPSTLGYMLGGYSWQKMEASLPFGTANWNTDGYFVGAGIETVLAANWTLKTEYRYSDYGTADPLTVFGAPPNDFSLSSSTHTFSIGANYRFGAQNGEASAFETPAYNWTGVYVGGAMGAGAMVNDQTIIGPLGLSGDGVFGEASIGYDHEFGDIWVLGALVDGRISNISNKIEFGGSSIEFKADYGFDVLARGGVKLSGSTLAYVLAGYSWQHFKTVQTSAGLSDSRTDNAGGYVLGAGLEAALTDKTAVNLEYRYSKIGNVDFGSGGGIGIEPAFHTVRVGAKYKFN